MECLVTFNNFFDLETVILPLLYTLFIEDETYYLLNNEIKEQELKEKELIYE